VLAKALFVLYFARFLAVGEFAKYFYYFSLAVVFSRILGVGADDELPYKVKGSPQSASVFVGVGLLYVLVVFALVPLVFFLKADARLIVYSLMVSFLLAGSSFSVGALRSIDNIFQEIRSNVPWILVCMLLLVAPAPTADQVVAYVVVSYLLVQLGEGRLALGKCVGKPQLELGAFFSYLKSIKSWLPKSVSTAAMAASLRSFPLWLGLASQVEADKIAYAFAIGEVSYQLSMTYVNLVHSSAGRNKGHGSVKRIFVVVSVFIALSVVLSAFASLFLQAWGAENVRSINFSTIFAAALYACSIAVFSFVRVLVWSVRSIRSDWQLVVVQVLLFAVPGALLWISTFSNRLVIIAGIVNLFVVIGYYLYNRKVV